MKAAEFLRGPANLFLFFARGATGLGVERIGKLDVPNILGLIKGEEADLIRFGGAHLADPDDAETSFAPEAANLQRLAGGSEKSDAIEACAILTEVHGERGLLERASGGVLTLNDDAQRFGNARFLAGAAPEAGKRLLESKANAAFALGVFVHVGDANLLFRSGDAIDKSDGISDGEPCLEKNKFAA